MPIGPIVNIHMDTREASSRLEQQKAERTAVNFLKHDRVVLLRRRGHVSPGAKGAIVEVFPSVAIVRFDLFPDETHEFKTVEGDIKPDR